MKIAIVDRPGSVSITEIPVPVIGEYDALCKIHYCATCTGTDLHLINGTYPFPIKYPILIGHENIGQVIEIGGKTKYLKKGDWVTKVGNYSREYSVKWGGFAEYGIAKDYKAMRDDGLNRLLWQPFSIHQCVPEAIDRRVGTMITQWRETLSYFTRMGVPSRKSLLITGSGGNGLAFAAHAKNYGLSRIVMVGHADRKKTAMRAGATDFYNYQYDQCRNDITSNHHRGFDVIIDAVGKLGCIDKYLNLLLPSGTIGIFGIDEYNDYSINPNKPQGSFTVYNDGYNEEETHGIVIDMIKQRLLDAKIWLDLDRVFPLDEISEAFSVVKQRRAIKVLIKP